jgi:DNA-binding protein HU-beta
VNKADLIEAVTKRIGDKRTANAAVEAFIDAVTRAVATGERVAITGFGVFEKVDRAARTARNPATGAIVQLKKTSVPKFRPGQGFKDVVSGAKEMAAAPVEFVMARTAVAAAAPAKRSATAKATAKKTAKKAAKKTTAKKAAKKTTAKKAAKKTTAKKAAKKTTAKKTTAKKAAKKTTAKKAAKKSPAKKAAKKTTAKKAAKKTARKAPAKR